MIQNNKFVIESGGFFFPVVLHGFLVVLSCFLLGTVVTLTSATSHAFAICSCVCASLRLLHSPILSNCKVIGALKPPAVEIYTPPPETPQAFHHLFLIPEITPLATTWSPHACHFEPH